jgi:hypothetical protein
LICNDKFDNLIATGAIIEFVMAIPDWNDFGVLPEGIHDCEIDEIEARLGFNGHRLALVEGLRQALQWLATMPPIESLIVDGSFVTDKIQPSDIDAVAMIGNLSEQNQREWVRAWQPHHAPLKQASRVDLYPTAAGQGNNFSAYFQYIRPEEALERGAPIGLLKGLLRIVP